MHKFISINDVLTHFRHDYVLISFKSLYRSGIFDFTMVFHQVVHFLMKLSLTFQLLFCAITLLIIIIISVFNFSGSDRFKTRNIGQYFD